METGSRAIFAFSWAQTAVEGIAPAPFDMVVPGALWRWRGEALRLDGPQRLLALGPAEGAQELRAGAARAVRRWLKGPAPHKPGEAETTEQGFTVTDGRRAWTLALAATGPGRLPVAVTAGEPPPRQRDLWVVRSEIAAPPPAAPAEALVCFTPGTMILCEDGPRPVELIREGMRLQTRDDGCQEVLWRAARRIGGARLRLMPELAPVRLRPDALQPGVPATGLVVSPDHRVLLRGPRARALFSCDEVLAAARDLVDDRLVRVVRGLREVTYLHLLLPRHQVILADGVETESFHPSEAALAALDPAARARLPADARTPAARTPARRLLSPGEAAIVAQAA